MLGRSTTPHSPAAAPAARHQSLAPHAASRRLQPCLLPPGALIQRFQHPSSSPSQQPVQSLCAGLAPASSSRLQQTQQQRQHPHHQHNRSCSHVARVVALRQDDSLSPEKQQGACLSSSGSSSQDALDVVPEAGVWHVCKRTPPPLHDRVGFRPALQAGTALLQSKQTACDLQLLSPPLCTCRHSSPALFRHTLLPHVSSVMLQGCCRKWWSA